MCGVERSHSWCTSFKVTFYMLLMWQKINDKWKFCMNNCTKMSIRQSLQNTIHPSIRHLPLIDNQVTMTLSQVGSFPQQHFPVDPGGAEVFPVAPNHSSEPWVYSRVTSCLDIPNDLQWKAPLRPGVAGDPFGCLSCSPYLQSWAHSLCRGNWFHRS